LLHGLHRLHHWLLHLHWQHLLHHSPHGVRLRVGHTRTVRGPSPPSHLLLLLVHVLLLLLTVLLLLVAIRLLCWWRRLHV
jgi:hypothetical protein